MVVPSCFPFSPLRRKQQKDALTTSLVNLGTRDFVNLGLCRKFTLAEMRNATNNFDEDHKIGVDQHGKIYWGFIDGGGEARKEVAIKCVEHPSQWALLEFKTKIEMISKLCHRHLVSLIGYCVEDGKKTTVYDYMPRGTLHQHLYDPQMPPLSWNLRLEICIGVARALSYLHHEASIKVIHADVSTANILLDENLVPKLSSFGRWTKDSLQDPKVMGSIRCMDLGYSSRQHLTEKSDVYSFGVVLFEVLCGHPLWERSLSGNLVNLVNWDIHCQQSSILEEIIDPNLKGKIKPECLKVFTETAMQCLADVGTDRPTMKKVLWNLEFALQLQERFNCKFFTFAEIRRATNDFDKVLCIGQGKFGNVYREAIEGAHVVTKHANPLGFREYKGEIEILFKLRHTHLVSLIGCYVGKWEIILVYEYMARGNLRDHLHGSQKPPLLWKQRLKICIGAARGLHYLHAEATSQAIVHGGVRTSNILLDYKWVSKLSDIGQLTRRSWQDPKGFPLNVESEKSDVYSFGLVLFEVLCARSTLYPSLPWNQAKVERWTQYCHNNDTVEEIIDPHLKGKIKRNCFRKFVETAVQCLADREADRPTMGDVVSDLELALRLQECSDVEDSW